MTDQVHQSEDKRKPYSRRGPAKPVSQGPAAPAPQPSPLALQQAIADPGHASPADILALQRAAGNRAATHLIQAKLTVGPAGDRYEQEANRVAEQVVGSQPSAFSGQPAVQRQMPEEEEEVQTKLLAASITPGTGHDPMPCTGRAVARMGAAIGLGGHGRGKPTDKPLLPTHGLGTRTILA